MKGMVFLPEIHAISGTKSLPRAILSANDGRDLEQVLASAGTIQILPRESLRAFHTARKAVEGMLLAKGTRFFGGFLVDEALSDDLTVKLDEIKVTFDQAKVDLIQGLSGFVEARVQEAPEWEDIIRSSAPRKEDLMEDISFSYISAPVDLNDPKVEQALEGAPLVIRIAKEMAQTCRSWLDSVKSGQKARGGAAGISVLRNISVKAEALSFVDGRFRGLVSALNQIIQQGELAKGTDTQGAASMVSLAVIRSMTDPAEIIRIADRREARVYVPSLLDDAEDTDQEEDCSPDPVAASAVSLTPAWAF